uniref:Uncharacterized protein n=1 Tax=viral metagenome TaxID=1070528 RepID=A0A6M3JVL2_9ZZZZ
MSNELIWNQPLPANYKMHCPFLDTPTNRKSWAYEIYTVIERFEGTTLPWDERSIKMDDAYDYCDAYNLKEVRNEIRKLHTIFFTEQRSINVDMDYVKHFFHDEIEKPSDNSFSEPSDIYGDGTDES